MRFAMSSSGVEGLAPFSDTAISKINLSSSLGKYGSRDVMLDIELVKIKTENEIDFPGMGWWSIRLSMRG